MICLKKQKKYYDSISKQIKLAITILLSCLDNGAAIFTAKSLDIANKRS